MEAYTEVHDLHAIRRCIAQPEVDLAMADDYLVHWCARNEHLDLVALLVNDPRINPRIADDWLVRWAEKHGHATIVDQIRQK